MANKLAKKGAYINGLVSVIIPTHRRADKLTRAIESVLNQTYANIELLIVDDNVKGDGYSVLVKELVNSIKDDRVSLVTQEKHINGAAARNAGIRKAKGEYIAFLDDDDFWRENKIEQQVFVLNELDPSYGGVSTQIETYNGTRFINASLPYRNGYMWEDVLLRRIEVSTSTILLRHEALDTVGYFDESLVRHQEVQLLSFFTRKYKLHLVKKYLTCVEIGDAQNRLDVARLIQMKREFFNAVQPLMEQLPTRKQKRVRLMHDFEVGYAMYKNGNKKDGLNKCLKVFRSAFTVYYAMERVLIRVISNMFKDALAKGSINITKV